MAVQNLVSTNPEQLNDRATALQVAVQADEANYIQRQRYTAAGAITPCGRALLQTGAASAMTLALPISGSQSAGGQDFAEMKITALDAHAYVVTTPADGINGADDTATFGGAAGDSMTLVAFGGVWYVDNLQGVTLSEV